MADLQRSRPSLRRRILGAFEPLLISTSSSPTSPSSPAMPTKVLRKKRRGPSTSPRPDIPQAYLSNERSLSPFGRMLQHHRAPSSDDAPATSTSSRSSSELHTPSSPGKRAAWDRDSPASSRSSLHRSNCVHGPKPVRASNPATVVAHDQMSSQHNGISFPVDDRHDESRPHSSSDYYRLTQTGNLAGHVGGHMRCFSQPNSEPVRRTGLTVHQQPSTLSLRSVDLNRDLPPLPFDQDKSVPPLPISRSSTSGSSDADEDDGEQDDFLLAPGTFARVVGEDEEENDDLDELCRHTAEGCSDHCCKPAALPLSLVIGPAGVSRRNSLPASLEGLKFVQAKLHDITPCDKTPRAAETAIFARSPGAAPRHRLTPAMKEALVQDGQRQSFLARAASLTKATTFTLKNVRTPRSLRRPGVPARIDEDARIAAA